MFAFIVHVLSPYLLNKNGQNFLDIQYMFAWSIAVKKNWSRPQQIFDNYQPDSIMVLILDGKSALVTYAWRKIVIYKIVFAPRILHVFVLLVHWIFEQLMNFILMCTLLRHRLTAQLSRAVRFKCARTKHAVSRWALSTECVADTETVSNSKQSISNFTNNFIKRTSNFTNFSTVSIC